MNQLALILGTYLLGAIPFGWVVGRVWGSVDVRRVGSGNIGTSNVMRTLGKGPALVVLLLDVVKGTLPVVFAKSLHLSPPAVISVAVAAVVGHIWSAFLRFNGGKGIATTLGVVIGLDWRLALSLLGVWLVVLLAHALHLGRLDDGGGRSPLHRLGSGPPPSACRRRALHLGPGALPTSLQSASPPGRERVPLRRACARDGAAMSRSSPRLGVVGAGGMGHRPCRPRRPERDRRDALVSPERTRERA